MDHKTIAVKASRGGDMEEAKCWCGRDATRLIKYTVPNAAVIETPTCEKHQMDTFNGVKWKLVADGTWFPGCLTLEWLERAQS